MPEAVAAAEIAAEAGGGYFHPSERSIGSFSSAEDSSQLRVTFPSQ